MAAARQNEMKVSITEVATKTLMAGRCRFSAGVDIIVRAAPGQRSVRRNPATGVHQCTAFSAYRAVLDQFRRAFSIGCFAEAFRRAAQAEERKIHHGGTEITEKIPWKPKLRASVSEPALSQRRFRETVREDRS